MPSSARNLDSTTTAASPNASPEPLRSLVARWRATVAAHPDLVAAADADAAGSSFTFAEVDRLSDLLALDIVRLADGDDRPVALMLGHDARGVIALVAMIKTGLLRVVLDTHLPEQRLAQIAALSTATLAIVDDRHRATADAVEQLTTVASFDDLLAAALASDLSESELAALVCDQLADGALRAATDPFEIVFTSGSTGVPKGVLQRHGSFLNELEGYGVTRRLSPGERVAAVLPFSFLAGSVTLTTTLLSGATAVLLDPRDTGIPALVDLLRNGRISALVCTPHLVRGTAQALADGEILGDVRLVVTLGEAIHSHDVAAVLAHLPADATYCNEVGSSEIDAIATYTVRQGDPLPEGNMPAGVPFANKVVRILGPDGQEVPQGEAGDVVVVSEFVSGGYWNNPELTAEKFGRSDDGVDLVRQGDLGRFDADGVLHLLGRGDSGVKVRGYLVEPSEIEGALVSLADIAEAVVIPQISTANPPEPTRLVAYVAPTQGVRPPSSAAIRRALRAVLPEYMVPSEIVHLASLPRTERGKIDRQSLPAVPPHVANVDDMDQRELAMSTIWQQVLELPELSPDDDFMALGGDSLSAEELLTLVKQHFGVELPSTEILAFPTLREFTRRVVSDRVELPSHPDVVPLNTDASGTPFFCFAGAGALALTFLPLARRFPDNPMYAFQQHGLEKRAMPDRSVEAMAARHLQAIRLVRPRGPYRLVGHSFGGVVALEVARQLTEAGQEVESVTILDTYLPRTLVVDDEAGTADTVDTAGTVDIAAQEPATALVATAPAPSDAPAARPAARDLLALPLTIRERFVPDGLPPIQEYGRQLRAHLAGLLVHQGQRQYDSFFDHAMLLLRKYPLRPFAGRAVLVIADENPDGPRAWDRVLTGERLDITMEAEHTSILREPHVATLAESMRAFVTAPVPVPVPVPEAATARTSRDA